MTDVQLWLKKLKEYGFTEKDFNSSKKELTKQFGKEAPDSDVIWGLFNKAILKNINNYFELSGIYSDMASFLELENRSKADILGFQQEAHKAKLFHYKRLGKDKVRCVATLGSQHLCKECEKLNGKIFTIEESLKNMPIPNKCKNKLCRCCYVNID